MDDIIPIVSLLVSVTALFITIAFNWWLRKRQYKWEYTVRNVEKIYIPLLAELNENLPFFDNFLARPDQLRWDFPKMQNIHQSGLFQFVKAHDEKLFENINLLYEKILPKFRELDDMRKEVESRAPALMTTYFEENTSPQLKIFASTVAGDLFLQVFTPLLQGQPEKITDKFGKGFTRRIGPQGSIGVPVSEANASNLIRIAKSEVGKLLKHYRELKTEVNRVVKNEIMPKLLEYIGKPL